MKRNIWNKIWAWKLKLSHVDLTGQIIYKEQNKTMHETDFKLKSEDTGIL